jgi:hypothetical protein
MIHNVFAITHNVIGFLNKFFVFAIDDATVALGCQYGFPTLLSPRTGGGGGLEDQVTFSKFQVALDLLKQLQDFLLFEMDVWFFRPSFPSFNVNLAISLLVPIKITLAP